MASCPECNGNGTLPCDFCQGTGRTGGIFGMFSKRCQLCDGEKTIPCSTCEKQGDKKRETATLKELEKLRDERLEWVRENFVTDLGDSPIRRPGEGYWVFENSLPPSKPAISGCIVCGGDDGHGLSFTLIGVSTRQELEGSDWVEKGNVGELEIAICGEHRLYAEHWMEPGDDPHTGKRVKKNTRYTELVASGWESRLFTTHQIGDSSVQTSAPKALYLYADEALTDLILGLIWGAAFIDERWSPVDSASLPLVAKSCARAGVVQPLVYLLHDSPAVRSLASRSGGGLGVTPPVYFLDPQSQIDDIDEANDRYMKKVQEINSRFLRAIRERTPRCPVCNSSQVEIKQRSSLTVFRHGTSKGWPVVSCNGCGRRTKLRPEFPPRIE